MTFFSKHLIPSAVVAAFILTVCGTITGVGAQSINDDLKTPKVTGTKPVKTPRQRPVKPLKQNKKNTTAVYRPPVQPPPPVKPAETPSDIIARYMNFQQSSTVSSADWDSVIKQSNEVLASNPNDKTTKTQLAVAQGQMAINRGDYSNALVQFNAAAQLMPESVLPYYGIGKVYLSTKQPNEAQKAFEKAIKINRNFALAYKGLGDVQTILGKTKKAQEYYKQAAQFGVMGNNSGGTAANQTATPNVGVNPTVTAPPPESPYERDLKAARNLTARKKWKDSLNSLQTLATTNPTADVYILMGDNYYGMRAWLSAQQAYRKASEVNPNSALAFYKSGQVLFETNEFQAAADSFEKALILDQSGATINRSMARKMADKAAERARNDGKDKKKLFIL